MTYAHAYTKHEGFKLVGFYDISIGASKLAAQKWNCDYFENISVAEERIDVVSICTPDSSHLESLTQAMILKPKLIFLEKPITNNMSEIIQLLKIAEGISIAINYSRRYVSEFQNLSQRISGEEFGKFIGGVGYYGKGFIHNRSHMIDLLRPFGWKRWICGKSSCCGRFL